MNTDLTGKFNKVLKSFPMFSDGAGYPQVDGKRECELSVRLSGSGKKFCAARSNQPRQRDETARCQDQIQATSPR
jgi:hypothetical protein